MADQESLYGQQDHTTSPSNYSKENDCYVHRLAIRSNQGGEAYDLTNQLADMVICEDMLSPCTRGSLTLVDAVGLATHFPFVGNEVLEVVFETPMTGRKFEMEFDVYNLANITRNTSDRSEMYDLQFVDRNYMPLINRSIGWALEGTIDSMVARIVLDAPGAKLGHVDPTDGAKRYIIPHWTAAKTLSWLAERAVGRGNRLPGLLLYSDRDGVNLHDVYRAFDTVPVRTYQKRPNSPVVMHEFENYITNINELKHDVLFDRIRDIDSGVFGSSMLSFDLDTRKLRLKQDVYTNRFRRLKHHLNHHPVFPNSNRVHENPSANLAFSADSSFKYGTQFIGNDRSSDWMLERNSFMADFRSQVLSMKVPGDTRLRLGDVVGVQLTQAGYIDEAKADPFDRLRSGNYLVTAIKHAINRTQHTMTVECSRDSIGKPIPDDIEQGTREL